MCPERTGARSSWPWRADAMARLIAYCPPSRPPLRSPRSTPGRAHRRGRRQPQPSTSARAERSRRHLHRHPGRQSCAGRHAVLAPPDTATRSVQVTVAARPCSASTTTAPTLGSYGPIPAQVARELAQDATCSHRDRPHRTGRSRCSTSGPTARAAGADLTRAARGATLHLLRCRCRQLGALPQPAVAAADADDTPPATTRAGHAADHDARTCTPCASTTTRPRRKRW